jgi:tetratricopeptide (TPR) repeat protein
MKNQHRGKERSKAAGPTPAPSAGGVRPGGERARSLGRRWLYRLVAAVGAPLIVLLLLEVTLRLAGVGYPTSFFVPLEGQTNRLVTNARFGWRFFPRELARSPIPVALDPVKPPRTFRIFLFGESAALGDPRPAYGVGRYLQALLEERFAGWRFEVVPAAMTAINSHALRDMAQECRGYDGDLWVVYMGNNEMAGPFGAMTLFGPQVPPLAWIRANLFLKTTRAGQWLAEGVRRLRPQAREVPEWTGLQMFAGHELPADDPRRVRVHGHFRRNLIGLLEAGMKAGVPVVVCTVASNLRDCPPFASVHSLAWNRAQSNRWSELIERGSQAATPESRDRIQGDLTEAARLDPGFAEVRFRIAGLALSATNLTTAREQLIAARDADALPFRADAELNRIVREAGVRLAAHRVTMVDAEQALGALAADGLPGHDLFLDHVHLTFDGNYQLARLLADQVLPRLPPDLQQTSGLQWASQATVEQRLGLTDWNRVRVYESMLQRFLDAPYTNQINQTDRLTLYARRVKELRESLHPRRYLETEDVYQAAIRRDPNDPHLHGNFAEFLEAINRGPEAAAQWEAVRDLLPFHFAAYANLGRLLNRLGKREDARRHLEIAVRLEPRSAETFVELAQSFAGQEQWPAAVDAYLRALRLQPGNARVHVQLADALAMQGKRAEAVEMLRQAARLDPGFWEARYLLGVELAVQGKFLEAQAEFEAALLKKPDHALSRLNLGVALIRQGRVGPARRQFEELLRLDPTNEKARHHLNTLDSLLERAGPPEGAAAPRR